MSYSLNGYNPSIPPGYMGASSPYGATFAGIAGGNPYMEIVNSIGSSVFGGFQPQMYQGGNGFTPLGGFQSSGVPGTGMQQQPQVRPEELASMALSLVGDLVKYVLGQQQANGAGQIGSPGQVPPNGKPPIQDNNPLPVNFKKNKSIQKRIDQLVSKDPGIKAEYSQLKAMDSQSPAGQQARAKLALDMKNAGYSDKQIAQFGALQSALELNKTISNMKKLKANLKKNSSEVKRLNTRLKTLRSSRAELEKQYYNPLIGTQAQQT